MDQQRQPDGQLGRLKCLLVRRLPDVEQFFFILLDFGDDSSNVVHRDLPAIGLYFFEGGLGALFRLIVQGDGFGQLRQLDMNQLFEFGRALGVLWIVGRQLRDFVDPGFVVAAARFCREPDKVRGRSANIRVVQSRHRSSLAAIGRALSRLSECGSPTPIDRKAR